MSKRKNSKSYDGNEIETQSVMTVGTQKLQDRASRITGNIFHECYLVSNLISIYCKINILVIIN